MLLCIVTRHVYRDLVAQDACMSDVLVKTQARILYAVLLHLFIRSSLRTIPLKLYSASSVFYSFLFLPPSSFIAGSYRAGAPSARLISSRSYPSFICPQSGSEECRGKVWLSLGRLAGRLAGWLADWLAGLPGLCN